MVKTPVSQSWQNGGLGRRIGINLGILLLASCSLFAEEKVLTCELIPAFRSAPESGYKLWVTNVSKDKVELCAEKKSLGRLTRMSWDPTDLYYASASPSGPTSIFPSFYAEVFNKEGKAHLFGEHHIRDAIQNPTGNETSFCQLDPGKSIACEYPILPAKPHRAVFHFLARRGETMARIQATWHADQPPSAIWEGITEYPAPHGDVTRRRIYQVPMGVKRIQNPRLPVLSKNRPVYDLEPWFERNGFVSGEIDFALFDPTTGLCLISTSEANHLKLKELHFVVH